MSETRPLRGPRLCEGAALDRRRVWTLFHREGIGVDNICERYGVSRDAVDRALAAANKEWGVPGGRGSWKGAAVLPTPARRPRHPAARVRPAPMSAEEQAAAVAEFVARRGVTRLPDGPQHLAELPYGVANRDLTFGRNAPPFLMGA